MGGPWEAYQAAPAASDGPWSQYAPAAPRAPMPAPHPAAGAPRLAAPDPSVGDDMASGLAAPFRTLGHDVMEEYRRKMSQLDAPPPSLSEAVRRTGQDLAAPLRIGGDALGLTAAPAQAIVRPVARAINRAGAVPYDAPKLSMKDGRPALSAPRALQGDEAQNAVEGSINLALSAAMPKNAAPKMAAAPKPMSLADMEAAKNAAYDRVDNAGVLYPQSDVKAVAKDIAKSIKADGGATLYPDSAKMAARINTMAATDLPLTQLEKLRGQVWEQTMYPGSKEAHQGRMMREKLDALIDTAGHPAVAEARDLNTRYSKMKEVSDRQASADLRASSTYGGGNLNNATRQSLRPLVDPKSPQRLRNLKPDERAALNVAVRGTAGQNAVRVAGKVLDPRSLIGGILQAGMGVGSGGASIPSAFLGMAATEAGNAMTSRNVQKLLDLISIGGVKRPVARVPYAPTPTRLLSPAGLIGAGEVAAPLGLLSADPSAFPIRKKKAGRPGR